MSDTNHQMKAVRIHQFGDSNVLVHESATRPEAQLGEVLIRAHAAGINPVDWKTRKGQGVAGHMPPFPIILGWDVSGTIAALGAGVNDFRVGDDVFGMIRFPKMGSAYAEYVSSPADHVALKPKSLDHVQAAAVPLAALTAWQALVGVADLQAGQRVLIHAAAGGVGHFAVQLAKSIGAFVTGTASPHNLQFVRDLGADEVFDYTSGPFEKTLRDFDVVLDTYGGEVAARSYQVMKKGGILVSILGGGNKGLASGMGLRSESILVKPEKKQLSQIADLIDKGKIRPFIQSSFPLAQAKKAHEISQEGHVRGKIVLSIP